MELIFDPRGLGLIATWQQRMAGGSTETDESAPDAAEETAPLFPVGDSFVDEENAEYDDAPAAEGDGEADEAPANEEAPGESAPVASSSPSASTESTTSVMRH